MNLKKTETNIPKNIFLCTLAVYFLLQGHLNNCQYTGKKCGLRLNALATEAADVKTTSNNKHINLLLRGRHRVGSNLQK